MRFRNLFWGAANAVSVVGVVLFWVIASLVFCAIVIFFYILLGSFLVELLP